MSDRSKPPEGWIIIEVLQNGETIVYRARAIDDTGEPLEWGDNPDRSVPLAAAWAHHDRITRATLERARDATCPDCLTRTPVTDEGRHAYTDSFNGPSSYHCPATPIRNMLADLEKS